MPPQSTRLTQSLVNSLTSGGKDRVRFWDAGVPGLILKVMGTGAKSYAVVYRDQTGRQREPNLGDARVLTLDQARKAALDVLSGVQMHGKDPVAERQARRKEAALRKEQTLAKLWHLYIEDCLKRRAESRNTLEQMSYRKHLEPFFGAMPVDEITLDQLAARLQQIVTQSGPAAANTALEVIRQMLNFAIQRGWTSNNVAAVLKPFPKVSRERVATEEELGEIWRALELSKRSGRSDSIACTLCLQLCLLTLQRRGEVAGIQFQEIDWKAKLWTIPGPRTKNKKGPHAVPLSDLAIEILKQAYAGRGSGFAFAGRNGEALDPHVPTRAFARLNASLGIDGLTVHDLRRTGATLLTSERLNVMGEIVSRILNHTPPGPAITQVYNRNTYLPQKRAALDAWAKEVERIGQ
ncbi:MAG: tyrosine-type recombinase/integrase [Hyphomonas sp.]|uniref:tyrosine-type recombinase/integrase n=1 Tax=Hyphomonas sp. TaxID=87 RepID=UPI0017B7B198|nr:tyrosine-type recombinase/integrase [Hyphomonas sp.]MBA3067830.1 tyrosine-type recombinase/integrase [Hyphomonas sp.]MBU3919953.1 tyrosine-type recombinase/integrase [Alphaproteobacteria bacterium]MBU4062386.1 tyrosine-type recombinase/integrase [Alphaproteobacteria bacterium]MBU4166006.1 tyrosine-type recombinase/integrase [Alphaproteobacteria bacterium]